MNVYPKQEDSRLGFSREGKGKGKSRMQVLRALACPAKCMCCLRWRILHVNRALSSMGRGCLSATFSRLIPFIFQINCQFRVWFFCIWFCCWGAFGLLEVFWGFFGFLEFYFKPSCFSKWDRQVRETCLQVRAATRCVKIQKSRKEALSPKKNSKQVGLLKKVNDCQGNTTHLPPLLSSSPHKSCGGGCSPGAWTAPRARPSRSEQEGSLRPRSGGAAPSRRKTNEGLSSLWPGQGGGGPAALTPPPL